MKPEDKKDMMNIVCEALEQVVLPILQKIDDKLEQADERFERMDERFDDLENKVDGIERYSKPHVERIDKQEIVITNHEKRINKLEVKMAVK
ncbi:MAG: hypothetical protein ACD_58C00006G0005 [uncultured bacterium]|nr:MAG: hypothetical protein ACD_58C00006G0005 [uncultured bacterium]